MKSNSKPALDVNRQVRNERLIELLSECERRQEVAFEELYSLCSAQLYGLLVRMLKIEAVAEEALQETFVKIWEKSGTYVPELGAPMAWMNSIARHQALDQLRQRKSREEYEVTDKADLLHAMPDTAKPVHEMSEDAKLLLECLEGLPDDARGCVVSAYCEGYSHEELAKQHGTPLGTIKSWIRRSLISLRRCVDELS